MTELVLFGGRGSFGLSDYTYIGDFEPPDQGCTAGPGPAVAWTNISSSLSVSPPARYYAAFTSVPSTNDVVPNGYDLLFGGESGLYPFNYSGNATTTLNDTWEFSLCSTVCPSDWQWTPVYSTQNPTSRAGAQMTYDDSDKEVVLFGGAHSTTDLLSDTWTFQAGEWTQLMGAGTPGGARAYGNLVWDDLANYGLLSGGTPSWNPDQGIIPPADFEFSGGQWHKVADTAPPGRMLAGMAELPEGNVTLFGGFNYSGDYDAGDTWWTGPPSNQWDELNVLGPGERDSPAMTRWTANSFCAGAPGYVCDFNFTVVLFGGNFGYTNQQLDTGDIGTPDMLRNDTWIFETWPWSEAPFSVQIAASPPSWPFSNPSNSTYTVTINGGNPPYNIFGPTWGDGTSTAPYVGWGGLTARFLHSFRLPGNFLVNVTVTDPSDDLAAGANLTYSVGNVIVPDWLPWRDTYNFDNWASPWEDGSCFGVSASEILYWEHDIKGSPAAPLVLPAPVASTANLSEHVGSQGGHPFVSPLNSTSLAILVHQAQDPANGLPSANQFLAANEIGYLFGSGPGTPSIMNNLQEGQPAMISMLGGSLLGSHNQHEVIVYGVQGPLPNASYVFAISDPNNALGTNYGYFTPDYTHHSLSTFWFNDSHLGPQIPYGEFAFNTKYTSPSVIQQSWLYGWGGGQGPGGWSNGFQGTNGRNWQGLSDASIESHGYVFVGAWGQTSTPVEVWGTEQPVQVEDIASGDIDSFTAPADTQSFVQGIGPSAGIEEGAVQVFAVSDPHAGDVLVTNQATTPAGSPELSDGAHAAAGTGQQQEIVSLVAPTQVDGFKGVEGGTVGITTAGPSDFTLRSNPAGLNLSVGVLPATVNITLFEATWSNQTYALDATNLSLPADSLTEFTVANWSLVDAPTGGAIATVYLDNGSGPGSAYVLTSNQSGLFAPGLYPVTFTETGLPSGTGWFVNVSGGGSYSSTTNRTAFSESNGTYNYKIGSANTSYEAAGGSFMVNGTALSESVKFVRVTNPMTFTESGIPAKTLAKDGWTVELNGTLQHSMSATITFPGMPNGTYALLVSGPSGWATWPSGGCSSTPSSSGCHGFSPDVPPTITLDGATATSIGFSKGATSTLTFRETGLPKTSGVTQRWCVEVDGDEQCSMTSTVKYTNLTASTNQSPYSYSVASPLAGQTITVMEGKASLPLSGSLSVTKSTTLKVTWGYDYTVTFTQTGLKNGTWSVTIKGVSRSNVTGDPIEFDLTNGTYSYKIGTVTGYTSSGSPPGRVTVSGASTSVVVTFMAKKGKSGPARGLELTGGSTVVARLGKVLGSLRLSGLVGVETLGLALMVLSGAAWTLRRPRREG